VNTLADEIGISISHVGCAVTGSITFKRIIDFAFKCYVFSRKNCGFIPYLKPTQVDKWNALRRWDNSI